MFAFSVRAGGCSSRRTAFGTVWPSGLRRWLQAPVRKGVGSNPTAVTFERSRAFFFARGPPCSRELRGATPFVRITRASASWSPFSCCRKMHGRSHVWCCRPLHWRVCPAHCFCDSLAEWSKALAQGASLQARGFEPHSCHLPQYVGNASFLLAPRSKRLSVAVAACVLAVAAQQFVLRWFRLPSRW